MYTFRKQPASALLTVLLLMTALSAVTLYVFRDALGITWQLLVQEDASTASQMAESALEQGLLRVKTPPVVEYGNTSTGLSDPYSLRSKVTGFRVTPLRCSVFSADYDWDGNISALTDIDKNCPYYSLVIRKNVEVTPDPGSNYLRFAIAPELIPVGKEIIFPITSNASGFSLTLSSDNDAATKVIIKINGAAFSQPLQMGISTFIPASATSISLTAQAPLKGRGVIMPAVPGNSVVMEKGATTIEATGYSGSIQRKLLLTIPAHNLTAPPLDPSKTRLTPFAGGFDASGMPAL